jgi:hypothetical protein
MSMPALNTRVLRDLSHCFVVASSIVLFYQLVRSKTAVNSAELRGSGVLPIEAALSVSGH